MCLRPVPCGLALDESAGATGAEPHRQSGRVAGQGGFMSVAREIAEIVGWPHWHGDFPVTEHKTVATVEGDYVASVWDPEHDLNHAIQAADLRWPKSLGWMHTFKAWNFEGDAVHLAAFLGPAPSGVGKGSTYCGAICAALRSAAPKEESDA